MTANEIVATLRDDTPALNLVREALAGAPGWVVGGAVRDVALGRPRLDIDVVVDADPADVAARLGDIATAHPRFGTVAVRAGGLEIDLARARRESYARPGALPDVRPGALDDDLARRDFTINAMAVPLQGEPELIDPHSGLDDLRAGLLRVLHECSLADDPTRAIRAARYASRLGFDLEPGTERVIRATNLGTVSRERVAGELRKLALEEDPAAALGLLVDWGLARADVDRARSAAEVARAPRFEQTDLPSAFLMAGSVEAGGYRAPATAKAEALAGVPAGPPSAMAAAARGASDAELLVARALGANWVDDYFDSWRAVRLEIGGSDLIAAGVPQGPGIGAGLGEALRRKLDGELSDRDAELAAALAAARR